MTSTNISTRSQSPTLAGDVPTLNNDSPPPKASNSLRMFLLLLFCLAQFLDVFNLSALFSAVPVISSQLHMSSSQSVWMISAYQLTFASFLLLSGRISDVYPPKYAFIIGVELLGFLCLGAGFTKNTIGLLVIRGISGLAGALTIPAALNLIVHLFPEEKEQARAIGIFGGTAALANILGTVLGAILTQFASWSWVFWFATIISVPIGILCVFLVPQNVSIHARGKSSVDDNMEKAKGLDIIGVTVLTVALILFIFGVTSGTTVGWGTAEVLVPLIISIGLLAIFFWYETKIPESRAALPPSLWFYPNVAVLVAVALVPYFWWSAGFYLFSSWWQNVIQWSPIISSIHFLPFGLSAIPIMPFAGAIANFFGFKRTIITGLCMLLLSTGLFNLGGNKHHYWPVLVPSFIIGTIGCTLVFLNVNIALFRNTPPRMAGTVGAVFNSALQMGAAVGISAATSIENSIEKKTANGPKEYKGRQAAFWFLFASVAVVAIAAVIFMKELTDEPAKVEDTEKEAGSSTLKTEELKSEEEKNDRPDLKVGVSTV
ncbi:MFS general substrate transporter [Sistotremastrum niveocremeum HHB9708]|uniref:MFS general substrate transporter n=2 Tax=Sistotremastraceae TaxID=3402574 RepID=A0A164MWA8_9AGAM|nr:MFS general substrate transporter [Sistotremastrum niveocremeum HHB9708]KZT32296.1 MFS general substrate transporter [Sistotremastrum suecicum HHB10207 ss-3]